MLRCCCCCCCFVCGGRRNARLHARASWTDARGNNTSYPGKENYNRFRASCMNPATVHLFINRKFRTKSAIGCPRRHPPQARSESNVPRTAALRGRQLQAICWPSLFELNRIPKLFIYDDWCQAVLMTLTLAIITTLRTTTPQQQLEN